MKNKIKNQKKLLLKQKKNLRIFIDYLVDSYYLNPKKLYDIKDIIFELKIENYSILETYINFLKNKKYIKVRKEKFNITFDGFYYLEKVQMTNKEYENNFCSITISMIAMTVCVFEVIFNNRMVNIILIIILFAFMNYQSKTIFNKDYY